MGVGGLALIGYVVGDSTLYYLTEHSTGMALHTASVFVLLGFFFFMLGIRPRGSMTTQSSEGTTNARPA